MKAHYAFIYLLIISVAAVSGCTQQLYVGPDICSNVICGDSVTKCADGYFAACNNSCSGGECSFCEPDCSGHKCIEEWICGGWGECDGKQARTCRDVKCGSEAVVDVRDCEQVESNVSIASINAEEEWVRIGNFGPFPVNLVNWTLRDNTTIASHVFTFPELILEAGAYVTVRKGAGKNNQEELYWGNNVNIWNNNGDTGYLRDWEGVLVSEYSY